MSTNTVEGSDDPGRIFIKRQRVRALVSALSLLQLQGCSNEDIDKQRQLDIGFHFGSWFSDFAALCADETFLAAHADSRARCRTCA